MQVSSSRGPAAIVSRRWLARDQLIAERASELGKWLQWLPDETASVIKTSHSSPDRPETDRPGQTSERVHRWTKQLETLFFGSISLLFLVKCSTTDSGKRIFSCWLGLATGCCKQRLGLDRTYVEQDEAKDLIRKSIFDQHWASTDSTAAKHTDPPPD